MKVVTVLPEGAFPFSQRYEKSRYEDSSQFFIELKASLETEIRLSWTADLYQEIVKLPQPPSGQWWFTWAEGETLLSHTIPHVVYTSASCPDGNGEAWIYVRKKINIWYLK